MKMRRKEEKKRRMNQDLDCLESKIAISKKKEGELPYPWTYSFKLLGVVLDCHWNFRAHFEEVRKKAAKRIHIIQRVSGTVWGMESRILAVSTHALVESVVNYGFATTGGRGGATDK